MKVDIQKVGNTLVVRPAGELDMHTAEAFRETADAGLKQDSIKNMVLVLSGISFIDSSGVGALLGRYRTIKERQGRMVLVGMGPTVRRVLEMSGVLRITETADSERRALARL